MQVYKFLSFDAPRIPVGIAPCLELPFKRKNLGGLALRFLMGVFWGSDEQNAPRWNPFLLVN
jgi:hypothetical protein